VKPGSCQVAALILAGLLWLVMPGGCCRNSPEYCIERALVPVSAAPAHGPVVPTMEGVGLEMLQADYWLMGDDGADDLLIASEEMGAYQEELRKGSRGSLVDMANYPVEVPGSEVRRHIEDWHPKPPKLYSQGVELGPEAIEGTRRNLNAAAVPETVVVRWGVVTRAAPLRGWPVTEGWFDAPGDDEFDIMQGSVLDPGEPLALLHPSADGGWWFVRAGHSDGWVAAESVGVTSREVWNQFAAPGRFLVVTTSRLTTEQSRTVGPLQYRMGARLPLWLEPWPERLGLRSTAGTWVVALPSRSADGALEVHPHSVPVSAGVTEGYLPYTRRNVLRLAFRMLGEPYGWGGLHGGEDCSYLVAMVYRCFGMFLPRNSWYQEQVPGRFWPLASGSLEELDVALSRVPAGASLHLKGHVMLYLGKRSGRHYVLHALAAYGAGPGARGYAGEAGAPLVAPAQKPKRIDVMRVVVSDLDLTRSNGLPLALSVTVGKLFVFSKSP